MKFKIDNRTQYRTRHLRSFIVRAYRIAATCAGPRRTSEFERFNSSIRITFARSNRRNDGASTGHATLNRGRAHIGIHDQPNKVDVALTIAHEIGHCFGLLHADMRGGPLDAYHWRTEDKEKEMRVRVFGWADALPLEKVQPKRKPKGDERRTLVVQRTLAAMARWQTKQKRARNALKRLEAKLKRLERQAKETRDGHISDSHGDGSGAVRIHDAGATAE